MAETDPRIYQCNAVARFRKTNEALGGLSNMAPGYPIFLLGCKIRTAEALYQACRFPHMPDVQSLILNEASPMTAKMRSKPFRSATRQDWDDVRVPIMKWCLRAKLLNNWPQFTTLLKATGDMPIVEDSRRDAFWGAVPDKDSDTLTGQNVLGRLLMELRSKLRENPEGLKTLKPVPIGEFSLLGSPIPTISLASGNVERDFAPVSGRHANSQPVFL